MEAHDGVAVMIRVDRKLNSVDVGNALIDLFRSHHMPSLEALAYDLGGSLLLRKIPCSADFIPRYFEFFPCTDV